MTLTLEVLTVVSFDSLNCTSKFKKIYKKNRKFTSVSNIHGSLDICVTFTQK